MIVYVLRHAEALPAQAGEPDEWRCLTAKGAAAVGKVMRLVVKHGRKPRLILTSPLVRSVQTAQIAAAHACRKNQVIVSGLLRPGSEYDELVDVLAGQADSKRVMLVGHEPHLGGLVAHLLKEDRGVHLGKSGCVALALDPADPGTPARFLGYFEPGTKPVTSFNKAFPET